MNNQAEIKEIIEQLKELQLQQAGLLERLDHLSEDTVDPPRPRVVNRTRSVAQPRPRGVIVSSRNFTVGDQVRILNPGPSQPETGTVLKIGNS